MIETAKWYVIARNIEADSDYVIDIEYIENINMLWKDAVKYAKSKYKVIKASKRYNVIYVK